MPSSFSFLCCSVVGSLLAWFSGTSQRKTMTWHSSLADFAHFSDEEIVDAFQRELPGGRFRRLSETVGVKRCTYREYQNLVFAHDMIHSCKLRVPTPLRYFDHVDNAGFVSGYMVMEYLDGRPWDQVPDSCHDVAVGQAIRYMHERSSELIPCDALPGPIDRQRAEGFPWGENGAEVVFKSNAHLAECANKRLRKTRPPLEPLDLTSSKLSLCHLDLASRNILILEDGNIALIDWETLALYPVEFELACLSKLYMDHFDWHVKYLLQSLASPEHHVEEVRRMSDQLTDMMSSLRTVDRMSVRYNFAGCTGDD